MSVPYMFIPKNMNSLSSHADITAPLSDLTVCQNFIEHCEFLLIGILRYELWRLGSTVMKRAAR